VPAVQDDGHPGGCWQDGVVRRADWVVVVPVKRLSAAKSRLRGAVDDARHEDLALAMLRDTLTAVIVCPEVAEVLVVTDDPVVAASAAALGARTVPDVPAAGLNAAVAFGADVATGLHRRRAVLAGDLPGLRPADLAEALRAAAGAGGRHFLRDSAGSGTVLLTAAPGVPLGPLFGVGSATAHAGSGATELSGDWPALRHDVDTPEDLTKAHTMGLGPHTSALLGDLAVVVPHRNRMTDESPTTSARSRPRCCTGAV
jgi:2-phospho-L-lactate guanylyltransferase